MAENLAALQLFSSQWAQSADPAARGPLALLVPAEVAGGQGFQQQLEALLSGGAAPEVGLYELPEPVAGLPQVGANLAPLRVTAVPPSAAASGISGKELPLPGSKLPPALSAADARAAARPPLPALGLAAPSARAVGVPAAPAIEAPLPPAAANAAGDAALTPLTPTTVTRALAAAEASQVLPASLRAELDAQPAAAARPSTAAGAADPVPTSTGVGGFSLPVAPPGLSRAAAVRPATANVTASFVDGQFADVSAGRRGNEAQRVLALSEAAAGQFSLAARSGEGGLALTPAPASGDALTGSAPASAASQLAGSLRTPVGSSEWSQGLGQRLLVMAEQGIEAARLRLNPASLGPLDIQISVDDDRAQVSFGAQHAATRDALEAALPRLRELFAEHGMDLTHADVRDGDGGAAHDRGESDSDAGGWRAAVASRASDMPADGNPSRNFSRSALDIYV